MSDIYRNRRKPSTMSIGKPTPKSASDALNDIAERAMKVGKTAILSKWSFRALVCPMTLPSKMQDQCHKNSFFDF